MKRAAAASAHGEPGAKRRPDSKPASVFKAELAKLRAFVEAHGAVPRRGVGVRAKAKAAVGVYAPGAKKPSPHKLAVPSSERELRLFLDRRLHEHKMLIKVVSKWIKSDGTFRAPWNGQFEELIAFRTTKGRWPEHLLRRDNARGVRELSRIEAALRQGGIELWELYQVDNEECGADCRAGAAPLGVPVPFTPT